jgi:hypothetical protein
VRNSVPVARAALGLPNVQFANWQLPHGARLPARVMQRALEPSGAGTSRAAVAEVQARAGCSCSILCLQKFRFTLLVFFQTAELLGR